MFVAVAFCPTPPLLHPEVLGSDGPDMGAALRSACAGALDRMLSVQPEAVMVIGAADRVRPATSERPAATAGDASEVAGTGAMVPAVYGPGDAGDLRGYGASVHLGFDGPPAEGGARVPLAHTLGAWLLDTTGYSGPRRGIRTGARSAELDSAGADECRWAMLVMGDGSARRTERSPGWFHPEAVAFDQQVTAAVASGDGHALLGLDRQRAERVLAGGVSSWHAAASVLDGAPLDARVHYAGAPFGVFYVVASWLRS